jgi:uncharacterized membrane protein
MIPPSPGLRRDRLLSVDALRGAVMIVMALDHVRDFVHRAAMSQSPTNLVVTTPALFMTRWVTHFCAPVFMLTAGIGAYFWWQNGRTRWQLSQFLVTRGLWLMLLEVTVMRLAYNFDVSASYPVFLLVLWGLGLCMIGLAALVWLPLPVLATVSVATIALHHLADGVQAAQFGAWAPLWNLVHQVGAFRLIGRTFITPYPLIPWLGVMALGFCIAPILAKPADERRRSLFIIGAVMVDVFLVLRTFNLYGERFHWAPQSSPSLSVLSFLNLSKYPPSLMFLLMTLGPALIALAWLDRRPFSRSNPLIVFGRVPLFYFVLHFFAAHVAAFALALVTYGSSAWTFMRQPVPSMGGPAASFPPGFGWDLWVAYAVWIAIVIALYPLCRWFAALKERTRSWWLSYL